VAFCLTSGLGATGFYYRSVLDKYNAVYANDKVAEAQIQFLGDSIHRNDQLMNVAVIFLILALPLDFFVCHQSKKFLRRPI
jgi:hypothetical protein